MTNMKYNAKTKRLEIDLKTLERVAYELRCAMRQIRKMSGRPLDKHKRPGPLEPCDHAEIAVIRIGQELGIDMGAEWGNEIDLRDPDDLPENIEVTREA